MKELVFMWKNLWKWMPQVQSNIPQAYMSENDLQ